MLEPYLVDERDVSTEDLGDQTYRVELWVYPSGDGSWGAVAVYETRSDSVGEVLEWALHQARPDRPTRIVVGVVTQSGDTKTFVQLHEEVVGYETQPPD